MIPQAQIPRDVGLLLALRRVRDGRVIVHGRDSFSHNQRPFPGVLIPYLRELLDHGQARLDAHADTSDTSRVLITEAGQLLLAELEGNRHSPDPGDAHREVGAQATESGGWSRTPACDDLAGRPRHMEFFLTEKGFLALRVPPGEIAVITPENFREVKKAFDEGHIEMMSTAVPLPSHLRLARARICTALGALDQSSWRFTFQPPALFAVRVWPRAAVDTLVVVGPEVVHARRDVLGVGPVWSASGPVERMVTEINALGCPHDPGDDAPANPNPGSTP